MENSNNQLNHKIDLSNEDHCGPCGQYALSKIDLKKIMNLEKEEKEEKEENQKIMNLEKEEKEEKEENQKIMNLEKEKEK